MTFILVRATRTLNGSMDDNLLLDFESMPTDLAREHRRVPIDQLPDDLVPALKAHLTPDGQPHRWIIMSVDMNIIGLGGMAEATVEMVRTAPSTIRPHDGLRIIASREGIEILS